jgi:hypothetical protein
MQVLEFACTYILSMAPLGLGHFLIYEIGPAGLSRVGALHTPDPLPLPHPPISSPIRACKLTYAHTCMRACVCVCVCLCVRERERAREREREI